MIILVLAKSKRSIDLQSAVEASGLVPDQVLRIYEESPNAVSDWGLRDVPALIKLHDGKAVEQIGIDWLAGKSAATIKGRITKAVNDYEAAKAQA